VSSKVGLWLSVGLAVFGTVEGQGAEGLPGIVGGEHWSTVTSGGRALGGTVCSVVSVE